MQTLLKAWRTCVVGLLLCIGIAAHAAPRMALLIGNNNYAGVDEKTKAQGHWSRLDKAVNDAEALGKALKNLGFDDVRVERDLGRSALIKAVDDFAKRAKQTNAEVALLYFGGHGAQAEKHNYLIPVDADKVDALAQIQADSVDLELLLRKLNGSAKLKIVWLDACRNTPDIAARSGSVGLTDVSTDERGADTVITFAAQPGKLSYEGRLEKSKNGLFAQGLLSGLATRGNLFGVVSHATSEVKRLSNEVQKPTTAGGNDVQEAFWFNPALQEPSAGRQSAEIARLQQEKEQLAKELERVKQPPTRGLARHPETGAPLNAGDIVSHPRDLGPKMVVLPKTPAEGYLMGSPDGTNKEEGRYSDEKQHRVTIPYVFAMSQTHVTFDDWQACVKGGGCKGQPDPQAPFGQGRMPVIHINHSHAREYVAWLNSTLGIQPSSSQWAYRYRLPSEIETEYATRAGTTTPFYTGNNITTAQANYNGDQPYNGAAKGEYRQRTTTVGSFAPNSYGLYDMAGNVWGWQADCYEADYDKLGDLKGAAYQDADTDKRACAYRSVRGGSWSNDAQSLRSANRLRYTPTNSNSGVGLRLTRMLPLGS